MQLKPFALLLVPNILKEAAVTYLGTVLSSNPKLHFDTTIKSETRVFYDLQCAGLCARGVATTVSAHMFNVAIQPILTYGCTTLNFTRSSVKELDKVQAKLLKSALGLPKFCHNTPLLQALKLKKIDNLQQVQQLSLIRNALLNPRPEHFICICLNTVLRIQTKMYIHGTLKFNKMVLWILLDHYYITIINILNI